jgi:hypothetical protein
VRRRRALLRTSTRGRGPPSWASGYLKVDIRLQVLVGGETRRSHRKRTLRQSGSAEAVLGEKPAQHRFPQRFCDLPGIARLASTVSASRAQLHTHACPQPVDIMRSAAFDEGAWEGLAFPARNLQTVGTLAGEGKRCRCSWRFRHFVAIAHGDHHGGDVSHFTAWTPRGRTLSG